MSLTLDFKACMCLQCPATSRDQIDAVAEPAQQPPRSFMNGWKKGAHQAPLQKTHRSANRRQIIRQTLP